MKKKQPVVVPESESELEDDSNDSEDESSEEEEKEVSNGKQAVHTPNGTKQRKRVRQSKVLSIFLKATKKLPAQCNDMPYKIGLTEIDWQSVASSSGIPNIQKRVELLCRKVLKNLALGDLLTLAKAMPVTTKRRMTAYSVFMKEHYHEYEALHHLERFKEIAIAYKSLTEAQKQRYADQAELLNNQTVTATDAESETETPKAKKKAKVPAKLEIPSVKSFFNGNLSQVSDSVTPKAKGKKAKKDVLVMTESTPITVKGASTSKGKAKDIEEINHEAADSKNTIPINAYQYFVQDRKAKKLNESAEKIKEIYANLSLKEKVQYIYRIMQAVEEKYKKRVTLSKPDQELLNEYEKRPQHPGTAYTLFINDKKAEPLLAAMPFGQRNQKIGAMWKEMSAVAREPYEKRHAIKKSVYEANHKLFLENLPEFRRQQETAVKTRQPRKVAQRRSSLSEVVPEEDEEVKPAKRRARAKTIDCSTRPIEEFFKRAEKRKASESSDEEPTVTEEVFVSPKKAKKEKKKLAKVVPAQRAPSPVPVPPVVREISPVSPAPAVESPKKKKKKVGAAAVQEEQRAPTPVIETPSKKSQKKGKKAKKLTEPEKPPESTKAYFKSIFTGDPSKAKKAFKQLSVAEKERYHGELKTVQDQYMRDLTEYMQSLTAEEIQEYLARNNS